jgi:hypothetical protein
MSDQTGALPQSTALAEAFSESLAELMSRDPEGYSKQDLGKLVAALRANRQRFQEAEATAKTQGPRAKGQTSTKASAEDLGL